MITESPAEDKENTAMNIDSNNKKSSLGQEGESLERSIELEEQYGVNIPNTMDEDEEEEEESEEEEEEEEEQDDVMPVDSNTNTARSKPPIANDFVSMSKRLMKPIPDYPVKDETYYVWEIKDWSSLKADKVRSPTFECGGFNWNILLFPRGNNNTHISVYMEPHPIPDSEGNISDDWYACAQFGLDIWNPNHPECHLPSGSSHRFNKNETDWGFSSLIDLKSLQSPNARLGQRKPILENNTVNITGYVKVIDDSSTGVLWHSMVDYDSKKNTGFVGLFNQGATCYLNSLLQSYFTTKVFRKLVYQIPTQSHSNGKSVPLNLQRTFYLLTTSNEAVGTMELTKSFGWESSDAFTQHDVQELNRILMDKLETAMKGSKIENSLNNIFVGKMKSYIKCVNVPYESSRVEDFWDIQLNVKGFKNLEDSFKNYVQTEMLEGENKYQAGDDYGYQDAKKGVVFQSFPAVLHLQLKRFEYDFMVDDLVKIDDFCEFPDRIDLKPYLDEELPESVRNQNWNYKLHGVLVHQGSISNGHYYAMIKPYAGKETWLRFDDDKVWKVTPYQVFQENFGASEISNEQFARLSRADQQENLIRRVTSAYMLVYYRESELQEILPDNDDEINKVIPSYIPTQIKFEKEERERLEKLKQESLYYMNVKFLTSKNVSNFDGFDLYPDPTIPKFYDERLINPEAKPLQLKVKKEDAFSTLYKSIGVELGYFEETFDIEAKFEDLPFRLIAVNHRNNQSNRSDNPVPSHMKNLSIHSIFLKFFNRKYDEMVFYVEEINKELHNVANTVKNYDKVIEKDEGPFLDKILSEIGTNVSNCEFFDISDYSNYIMIFLKYYNIKTKTLSGLTHAIVSKDLPIKSLLEPLSTILGTKSLKLFEELSHSKIESLDPDLTFEKSELNNGDIITVEESQVSEIKESETAIDTVKEYYKFLLTRLHISVSPYSKSAESLINENDNDESNKDTNKSFDFWISSLSSYSELIHEVGKRLGDSVDPSYLRLFILNNSGQRYPIKSTHHLSQFFPKTVPISQTTRFEYEILKIPLQEYENLKHVKIYWLNSLINHQYFELLVPKDGSVSDIVKQLLTKVTVPEKDLKDLLVWSGLNHKYYDLVRFEKSVESLNSNLEYYAGIFPAEVEILTSHDMIKRYIDVQPQVDDYEDPIICDEFTKAQAMTEELNLIPAFHFHKSSNYHHGIPFILPVYPDEKFSVTKERLKKKLGLGIQAFDKIKFALADENDKGLYIDHENDNLILFDEINKSTVQISFALDHPDRSPRRQNHYDKGISIK